MRNPTKNEVNFKSCGTPGNHDSASWPITLALKGALQQTVSLRLIKTTEFAFCTIFVTCHAHGIICDHFKIDFGLLKIEKLTIQMYEYVYHVQYSMNAIF